MELLVKNVSRKMDKKIILEDVNLSMESGKIYVFVGRNGSGKTTLFRLISGLINLSNGEIIWDGKILGKDIKIIPKLGLVLENAGLYPELSAYENLKMLADINKVIGKEEIIEVITRVGLDPNDKKPFKKFSLGMKQRLMIAQAIMEKPDIILLDEPTNALDFEGVEDVRKLLLEEKERGALILLATHNTEDIKVLADEIYTVKDGRIQKEEI